jgi:hypothetical protein
VLQRVLVRSTPPRKGFSDSATTAATRTLSKHTTVPFGATGPSASRRLSQAARSLWPEKADFPVDVGRCKFIWWLSDQVAGCGRSKEDQARQRCSGDCLQSSDSFGRGICLIVDTFDSLALFNLEVDAICEGWVLING